MRLECGRQTSRSLGSPLTKNRTLRTCSWWRRTLVELSILQLCVEAIAASTRPRSFTYGHQALAHLATALRHVALPHHRGLGCVHFGVSGSALVVLGRRREIARQHGEEDEVYSTAVDEAGVP